MSDIFLVGRTIIDIQIAEDKKAILFKCDDGDHIAKVEGDCCSETWIENVDVNVLSFPCMVLKVDDLDMPDDNEIAEFEVIAFYGLLVITDRGTINLDYRNLSNGYYGGGLFWPDDGIFDDGVYGQNKSNEKWQSLTEVFK